MNKPKIYGVMIYELEELIDSWLSTGTHSHEVMAVLNTWYEHVKANYQYGVFENLTKKMMQEEGKNEAD